MASSSLLTALKFPLAHHPLYSENRVFLSHTILQIQNRDNSEGLKRETLVDNPSKCFEEYKIFVTILLSFCL